MKKHYFGMLLGIMVLAAGCSVQSAGIAPGREEAEAAASESQAEPEAETPKEEETSEKDAAKKEKEHKAAEESIQAAEESLKAMEESLKAAEESLAAAEEQEQQGGVTDYAKLVGNPGDYLQKQVRFSGRIVRFAPIGSTAVQIVLAADGKDSKRVVGEYQRNIVNTGLAVGDQITLSGEFQGMVRYRMQTGGTESMPTVDIEEIRDIVKAQPETVAATFPAAAATDGMGTNGETTPEPGTEPGQESQEPQEIEEESESESRSPVISAGE